MATNVKKRRYSWVANYDVSIREFEDKREEVTSVRVTQIIFHIWGEYSGGRSERVETRSYFAETNVNHLLGKIM